MQKIKINHRTKFRDKNKCFQQLLFLVCASRCSARNFNLVPRVLRLFGQQLAARRDSGEFVTACIVLLHKLPHKSCGPAVIKFRYCGLSPGAHPLTKKPEDSGYEEYEIGAIGADAYILVMAFCCSVFLLSSSRIFEQKRDCSQSSCDLTCDFVF